MEVSSTLRSLGLRNTLGNRSLARSIIKMRSVLRELKTNALRRQVIDELRQVERDVKQRNNALRSTINVSTLSHDRFNEIFRPIFRQLTEGNTYQIIYLDENNRFITSRTFTSPRKYLQFKYNVFFRNGSDEPPDFNGASKIIINSSNTAPERLRQVFRDGYDYHCVLDAVIAYYTPLRDCAETKDTRQRYTKRINEAERLKTIYSNGVPEDKMEEVAKLLCTQFRYDDLFANTSLFPKTHDHHRITYNKENRHNVLQFINNRENHLEVLTTPIIEEVEQERIDELSNQPDVITRLTRDGRPTNVYTPTKHYHTKIPEHQVLINKQRDQISQFGLPSFTPYANFVKSINLVHSIPVNLSNDTPTHHKDIEKAYYNHNKAPNYQGLLGNIHQFRKLDNSFKHLIKTHLGFYTIRIISVHHELITKLVGLTPNQTYTIFSPEIQTYEPFITYDLLAGFWGSRTDIQWLPGMEQKVLIDGKMQSLYAIFVGQLGSHEKKYKIKTSQSFANHIATMYPTNYFENTGEAVITLPPKSYIQDHIFASITSYTRIMLFTELQKLNTDQIIRVVLDGVYFRGEDKLSNPLLKIKEVKTSFTAEGDTWYSYATNEVPNFPTWKTPSPLLNNSFLTGQGGSGKTTAIFDDTGYNLPLYITPTNELGRNSNKHWTTIHRLIGKNCTSYLEQGHRYPPVLVVDEMTLHTEEHIEKLKKMYSNSLIIFIGDINIQTKVPYQLTIDFVEEAYRIKDEDIIHFPHDYRSLDDNIKQLKLALRNMIDNNIHAKEQQEYLKTILPVIPYQTALELYNPTTDQFITGKHRKEIENYKTIHSIQGQTYTTKTFIMLDMFSVQMPYTAISRVRNFNQIYLVSPPSSSSASPPPPSLQL